MRKDAGATMNFGILRAFAKSEDNKEVDKIKSKNQNFVKYIDWLIADPVITYNI